MNKFGVGTGGRSGEVLLCCMQINLYDDGC